MTYGGAGGTLEEEEEGPHHLDGAAAGGRADVELGVPLLAAAAGEALPPPPAAFTLRVPLCHIPPGARVAVAGPTGNGKSTLFRALLRLWPHARGSLHLNGRCLSSLTAQAQRACFALMPQRQDLLQGASLLENVLGPAAAAYPRDREAQLVSLLQGLGLQQLASQPLALHAPTPAQLSGSEVALLLLARVLARQGLVGGAARAEVVLLDEPTAGWREGERGAVLRALQGRPEIVLWITHGEVAAGGFFTHVLRIEGGVAQELVTV